MSDLNLQWLEENFSSKPVCLMNIGCADLTDDSLRFKIVLPNADIWSFECAEHWRSSNTQKAEFYGMNYVHMAVSDFDGIGNFYCGVKTNNTEPWQYRGFLDDSECVKMMDTHRRRRNRMWSLPQHTEVISLNTFCSHNHIKPNFLHIDTEGEEYNILKNLQPTFWPEAIWLECWDTYRNTGSERVEYSVLHDMLLERNYQLVHKSGDALEALDALYVRKDFPITPYIEYTHNSFEPTTQHEIFVQQQIWLLRYNLVKDATWPNLTSPGQFYSLPELVQDECKTQFNLAPISKIC